jgi:hypothetical protein
MSFTDLWRCKHCNELPEILFRGKNFLIKCKTCNSRRTEVYATSLDEVVSRWNKKNNPIRPGMFASLRALPARLKDFLEYQFTRRAFIPAPPLEEEPSEKAVKSDPPNGPGANDARVRNEELAEEGGGVNALGKPEANELDPARLKKS